MLKCQYACQAKKLSLPGNILTLFKYSSLMALLTFSFEIVNNNNNEL